MTGDRAVIRWETRVPIKANTSAFRRPVEPSAIRVSRYSSCATGGSPVPGSPRTSCPCCGACRKGERRRLLSRPHDSHASRSGCGGISTAEEGVESKERPPHLLRRAHAPIAMPAQKEAVWGRSQESNRHQCLRRVSVRWSTSHPTRPVVAPADAPGVASHHSVCRLRCPINGWREQPGHLRRRKGTVSGMERERTSST